MGKQMFKLKSYGKNAILLLFLCCFSCHFANAQGKGGNVTLKITNTKLSDALREVEKRSEYKVIFAYNDVESFRVSANLENVSAPQAVKTLIAGKPLSMSVENKYIRVFADKDKSLAQKNSFRGKVVDEDGSPLPGVTVRTRDGKMGGITDFDGVFTIPDNGRSSIVLQFSFLGKKDVERTLRSDDGIEVKMIDDATTFDDVIVTGYQTMSKREAASAVSTVKMKEIMVEGAASIDQMLQGRIPGMSVMMTSGEPSATPKIRIRGNATINGNKSPVWVVDGVILEQDIPFTASDINSEDAEYLIGNAISGMNPQDIESITVLKDASATAIYGVKAANGVIVITTKKGYAGKPIISYNGNLTVNTRPNYENYNIMNSKERVMFSKMLVDRGLTSGRTPYGETYEGYFERFVDKQIDEDEFRAGINRLQTRNTNWFKELFQNNVTHTHTASISGGTEKIRYYMSSGFSNVQASARESGTRKFNALAKIDAVINRNVDVQAKFQYSTTRNRGYHSSINPFNYAYNTSRTIPAYNDDGSYYKIYGAAGVSGKQNVGYNVIEEMENTGQKAQMDNFDALFALNVKILKGLTYQGVFSWSQANTSRRTWAKAESYYIGNTYRGYDYGKYTPYDTEYFESTLPYGGVLEQGNIRRTGYTVRNQVQYKNYFGAHSVDLLGGVEARRNAYKGVSVTGYGWVPEYGEMFNPILTDKYLSSILNVGKTLPTNTNSFTQVASFYGIASYGYRDRYVLNFNIRSDGSNKFGSNPKYRWLPTYSFALKWNIHKEPFMKNVKWVNDLALRTSYGVQGNINEDSTPYLVLKVGDIDNILALPTSKIYLYPNPDLRWEKTHSWDVAIDFRLLNDRIRGSFDVYGKRTKDLIINKRIASSNGTTRMLYNAGKMDNKGFEGFINVGLIKTKDWEWRAGVNFSRNINEIIYADNGSLSSSEIHQEMLNGNMPVEGAPIGSLYAYHYAGVNEATGLPMHYTKDGKKSLQGNLLDMELVRVGSIFPKLTGGFDSQLTYREWSLGVSFSYSFGAVDRLPNYYSGEYNADPTKNVSREWLDSYTFKGADAKYPGVFDYMLFSSYIASTEGEQYNTYDEFIRGTYAYCYNMYNQSDVRIAKTDFLKLKLVSLTYNVPKKFITPLNIRAAYLRLQVTNLFTICSKDWHGLDPETRGVGIPQLPAYSLTVNVSF